MIYDSFMNEYFLLNEQNSGKRINIKMVISLTDHYNQTVKKHKEECHFFFFLFFKKIWFLSYRFISIRIQIQDDHPISAAQVLGYYSNNELKFING